MGELALSIHAGWRNNEKIGTVFINNVRGKEIYSFEYEHEWLVKNKDLYFDPDIQPFMGRQYLTEGKETYGLTDGAENYCKEKIVIWRVMKVVHLIH